MSYNRIERLAYIFSQLSSSASLSTKDLAIQFDTTVRIIQLDFNEYVLSYFQDEIIKYDFGTKKYYATQNFLDTTFLSAKELAVLSILKCKAKDKYSDKILYDETVTLFDKLEDSLKHNIYTNPMMEHFEEKKDDIIKIKNAIMYTKEIECIYDEKKRVLQPLKIINFEQYWYLINYDIAHQEIRKYHLNTINEVKILPSTFSFDSTIIESFDNAINAYYKPYPVKPFRVELYLDSEVVKYFKRKPLNKTQIITQSYPDGACDIEVFITSYMEIIPLIQKFIPFIKVISPDELNEFILEDLKAYIQEIE